MSALDQGTGSSSAKPVIQTITVAPRVERSPEREGLGRRVRLLAWGGITYHFVEFAKRLAVNQERPAVSGLSPTPKPISAIELAVTPAPSAIQTHPRSAGRWRS